MGSIAGNDQNALLYDFMQKIGIKYRKICNGFRNFQMICNARKTFWMALYARELKTAVVKKNMQLRHGRKLQSKAQ